MKTAASSDKRVYKGNAGYWEILFGVFDSHE